MDGVVKPIGKKQLRIVRTNPAQEVFFREESVPMGDFYSGAESFVVNIYDEVVHQTVLGFGGSFTESAAYNYSLMDSETKAAFMRAYFDKKNGIGYNFGRTHINSCDFSLDIYSYVEEGDMTLETFDISRDRRYIIPFIKDAMQYAEDEIFLMASPWSPPAYMKTNNSMVDGGKLRDEYKQLWALYYSSPMWWRQSWQHGSVPGLKASSGHI